MLAKLHCLGCFHHVSPVLSPTMGDPQLPNARGSHPRHRVSMCYLE